MEKNENKATGEQKWKFRFYLLLGIFVSQALMKLLLSMHAFGDHINIIGEVCCALMVLFASVTTWSSARKGLYPQAIACTCIALLFVGMFFFLLHAPPIR